MHFQIQQICIIILFIFLHLQLTYKIMVSYAISHSKCHKKGTGGHLNKKDGLTRYGDSHVKDKTS